MHDEAQSDKNAVRDERGRTIVIRPDVPREPMHPSITEAQIDQLVERFYRDAWDHERLGPLFAARVADRPAHLAKMKRFWSSVLLKTGAYRGRPIPAHMPMKDVVDDPDFTAWLGLFERACRQTFEPDAVPVVTEIATRIARTIWSAMTLHAPRPVPF
jgi:hemoglobin